MFMIVFFLLWVVTSIVGAVVWHYFSIEKCPKGKGIFKGHDWESNYYNKGYFFRSGGYTMWHSESNTCTCRNCGITEE